MEEVRNCPLCGDNHFKELYSKFFSYPGDSVKEHIIDNSYTRRWIFFKHILKKCDTSIKISFLICKKCGFIFTSPRPSEEDIKTKYNLINSIGSTKAYTAANPLKNVYRRASIIHNQIHRSINNLSGKRILDFGGASGHNLILFTESNCYVVDYEKWELPEHVTYLCQTIDELPLDMKFDVILCCHVLEHVIDPVVILNTLKKRLTPKGIIYIEVPLECFHSNFRVLSDPITHINFFSNASLSYLLSKCEFSIEIIHSGFYWLYKHHNPWISVITKQGRNNKSIINGYKSTIRQIWLYEEVISQIYKVIVYIFRRNKK